MSIEMEENYENYDHFDENIGEMSSQEKKVENNPNVPKINSFPPNYEENVIRDLEVWKRAEQTKFKAYIETAGI